jgi:5-formyltetrahydrofolate cyclo-ligase
MKDDFRNWAIKESKKSLRFKHQDVKIVNLLKHNIEKMRLSSILLYTPLKTELNISPLIDYCRKKRINLYVPFMEGKSFSLVKYRLPLQKRCFGIKEPKFSKQYRVRDIDLAIIPIVGVDYNCRRVGFGKGMYDRFFEREGRYIKKSIFIQRTVCYSQKIITDEYDIEADMIFGHKIKVWSR